MSVRLPEMRPRAIVRRRTGRRKCAAIGDHAVRRCVSFRHVADDRHAADDRAIASKFFSDPDVLHRAGGNFFCARRSIDATRSGDFFATRERTGDDSTRSRRFRSRRRSELRVAPAAMIGAAEPASRRRGRWLAWRPGTKRIRTRRLAGAGQEEPRAGEAGRRSLTFINH
jgi:hypothetical protein